MIRCKVNFKNNDVSYWLGLQNVADKMKYGLLICNWSIFIICESQRAADGSLQPVTFNQPVTLLKYN